MSICVAVGPVPASNIHPFVFPSKDRYPMTY